MTRRVESVKRGPGRGGHGWAFLIVSAVSACAVAGPKELTEVRFEAAASEVDADASAPGAAVEAGGQQAGGAQDGRQDASVPDAGLPQGGDAAIEAASPNTGDAAMHDAVVDVDVDAMPDAAFDAGDVGTSEAGSLPGDAGAGPDADAIEASTPEAGCNPGADGDGDSLLDCVELGDDDPFTDPGVFNGVRVQTRHHSYTAPACFLMDTVGEVRGLLKGPPDQELEQYAGWDFDDLPDNRTHPGYGFLPPWTVASLTWQIDAVGYVKLAAGRHCFEIAGRVDQACGTLFIANTPAVEFAGWDAIHQGAAAVAEHGSGIGCFDAAAGVYPIRWHYEMDDVHVQEFHLRYCHGGDSDCTPELALPSRMLRVQP